MMEIEDESPHSTGLKNALTFCVFFLVSLYFQSKSSTAQVIFICFPSLISTSNCLSQMNSPDYGECRTTLWLNKQKIALKAI